MNWKNIKKLLKIFLFVTVPIWAVPYAIYFVIKETWLMISEYVDKKVN